MPRIHAIIPALAILAIAGCDKKPADADIDMRSPTLQSAEPTSRSIMDTSTLAVAPVLDPSPVTAEDGSPVRIIESCNVEQVNGQLFAGNPVKASRSSPISVSGWVIDELASGPAELRLINVADASTYKVAVTANVARPDVVEAFEVDPATTKPGFNVVFNAVDLPPGDYRLQIVVASVDRGASACDNGRVISLVD